MSPLVPTGTPIAVVAPCGVYNPEQLAEGIEIAKAAGHDLRPMPGMLQPHRYLAGDDAHRLTQLMTALTSPEYGAVWVARGGYGLTRIVDRIHFDALPPRPVLGFSDVTALLTPLHAAGRSPAIHAPMPHSLPNTDEESRQHLWDLLAGKRTMPLHGDTWIGGEADGWLAGGNLCLLAATCGTPQQLKAGGAILVLEEIGEPAYRVDRMLRQIVAAGVLDGVLGVAVGELLHCNVPEGADYGIDDVLMDHLAPLGVPILGNLPIGHGPSNRAFLHGACAWIHDGVLETTRHPA